MKTKNKRNYLKEKGITLIALVVTIVVLLILAGVSVNALFGNNGIIEKAKDAQSTMTKAEEKDRISVALTEWEIVKSTEKKTFEKFMKETFGDDNVTAINENEVIVTMESGNKYKVTTDGVITSTKGVSINKSSLTLELQEGATVTETLTAILSEITGEITWSNSDNSKATISSTTGESITVTAVAVGTTTITATCGEYTATCIVTVTKPVSINRGAFVEYDVTYTDAGASYEHTKKSGWRLLDYTDNGDGTLSNVKLISTGVPAKLYCIAEDSAANSSWHVKDETRLNDFRNVLTNNGQDDYTFLTDTIAIQALQVSAGLYYNFGDIKFAYGTNYNEDNKGFFTKITVNGTTYDSTNTTETTGSNLFIPTGVNASVRLITLPEIHRMSGETDVDNTAITDLPGADGIFVLQNLDKISSKYNNYRNYGSYFVASPIPIKGYGCVLGYANRYAIHVGVATSGVRPIICLTSNIRFVDLNGDGVLEIQNL